MISAKARPPRACTGGKPCPTLRPTRRRPRTCRSRARPLTRTTYRRPSSPICSTRCPTTPARWPSWSPPRSWSCGSPCWSTSGPPRPRHCARTTCPPRWPRCAAACRSWSRSTRPGSRSRTSPPPSSTPTGPPSARARASSRRCTGGWSSCSATSPRPCSCRTAAPPTPTPSWRRRSPSRACTTRCCGCWPAAATTCRPPYSTATRRCATSRTPGSRPSGRTSTPPRTRTACSSGSARLLTDVAELVWRWRNDHLVATRRAMGSKPGTGGSAGVAWLEKRATKNVFPELWTARSHV